MVRRRFEVFLCHSEQDKPAIERIANRLVHQGIQPWLDKWNLVPGEPWQEAIEDALEHSATCAVFLGPGGVGPWQNEEMRVALDRRASATSDAFRVIPVLLPGAKRDKNVRLPTFLTRTTWVEFHRSVDEDEGFQRLVSGIRGEPPGEIAEALDQKRTRLFLGWIYALTAMIGFSIGITLLFFYLDKVPDLIESRGVSKQSLYLLLVLWGLASATFLFGSMRGYASFTRRRLGNAGLLSAAGALFCLVLLGGFHLIPNAHLSGLIVPTPDNWQNLRVVLQGHKAEVGVDKFGAFDIPMNGNDGDQVRLMIYRDHNGTRTLVYDEFQTTPGPVTIALRTSASIP